MPRPLPWPARPALWTALALHGLLLLVLVQWTAPRREAQAPQRSGLLWLLHEPAMAAPSVPAQAQPAPRRSQAAEARGQRGPAALAVPAELPQAMSPSLQPPQAPDAPAPASDSTVPIAAAPPASAPPPLLRQPGTQRAIRDIARQRSVGEEAARATQAPQALTADERLGRDVARAAKGDCLKGEYAGGGMGILSLPFWLAAEATGQCRR